MEELYQLAYEELRKKFVETKYRSQVWLSKKRKDPAPAYTKEELLNNAVNDQTFCELFNEYILSGFDTEKSPSFDRKDAKKPYTFDNCEWVTWEENNRRAKQDRREGKCKANKAVDQFTLNGEFVASYASIAIAERQTGISCSLISRCRVGHDYNLDKNGNNVKCRQAGGFIWKAKGELPSEEDLSILSIKNVDNQ
jgi:hypothetical protein